MLDAPTTAVMPLGKVQTKPVDISRDSPMTVWLRLMAPPAAPKTGLSRLELDGCLLRGAASRAILPSRWLAGLRGDAEPVFDDDAQIDLVARAVMDRCGCARPRHRSRPRAAAGGPHLRLSADVHAERRQAGA